MHSIYSPSASSRWLNCPGSIHAFPPPEEGFTSEAAQVGTAAHWLFEDPSRIGTAPNGIEITDTIRDDVMQSLAEIDHLLQQATEIYKEVTLDIGRAMGLQPGLVFGTADLVLFDGDQQCHLIDFKYGRYPVYPKHNDQLLTYAVGLLPNLRNFDGVWLHILQPRSGGLKSWFVEKQQVQAQAKKIKNVVLEKSTLINFGEWCTFCPHKKICNADPF